MFAGMKILPCFMVLLLCLILSTQTYAEEASSGWKAGVASVKITPEKPIWMAGYASRNKPSEGIELDIYAKALAIEDASGTRFVMVTTDLIGIPRTMRHNVEALFMEKFKLPAAALLLNASHTHCGPEIRYERVQGETISSAILSASRLYTQNLEQQLIGIIGQAINDLEPVNLTYSYGRAGFAMNRRTPTEKGVRNHPYPEGPVDHQVPVLKVTTVKKKLKAVLFGYACHNTTMSFYKISGDYAGFAQKYIEELHPGTLALFMMGCGGDQNPYPRRKEGQAAQHGRALANGVETALQAYDKPVTGKLGVELEYPEIEFATPPTKIEVQALIDSSNKYDHVRGTALMKELETSGKIRTTYPYTVQVARIGNITLVALAGEVVIDYSLRLKKELQGDFIWIAGYSNDVFGYVPSARVIHEGGYEAGGAMRYTRLPGPFSPSIEKKIISTVIALDKKLGQAK
ncbi:MAG: neutral/alkaline non-lysosomal ceramidase N-terminal domain-containing protein [Planctomycetaceae bacterium]|nr:neutral/alkaline non-lysosomal ceramidase N-terminal domain-containing protein [Planctomycetaceae bacterium]